MTDTLRGLLADCADMLDHLKQIASFEDEAEAEALIARIGEALKPQPAPVSCATLDMMDMARSLMAVRT